MLVANSFDLWQKDTFFSAAEEVQQSADIMESAYRTWLRARREGLIPQHLDELSRELQMALGTAKWQLEEFERAVRMSYKSHGDDITISRHRQFVSAIEGQISNVETALKESFNVDGKKPFRWVHLDEEECDDLALFLSGTSQHTTDERTTIGTVVKNNTKEDNNLDSRIQNPDQGKIRKEVVTSNEDSNCFMEQQENRFPDSTDKMSYQDDRIACNRKTLSSPNKSALEIVIDVDDRQKNAFVEATPKEKGSKPIFWSEDHPVAKGGVLSHTHLRMINWINQRLRGHRNQRPQVSTVMPVNSIRFMLGLMLTIFLVVPFLVYSA
ncbi:hypothetical protein CDL12_25721 [Handroanthus impetiginosus]|uniref:Syntaxin 6/10/61 N-terminal domain-containing protein n=1 Tax=Handroanthus impetiginosus TaxID=429701 RepID=A0A2G9G973_9LAMI|nr:hypothetical protein CDL12_25721 [Handroanthus impetiginosus]